MDGFGRNSGLKALLNCSWHVYKSAIKSRRFGDGVRGVIMESAQSGRNRVQLNFRGKCFAWHRLLAVLLATVGCFSLPGCVFRRMTIRSDPPGALVLLEGEEVGYTPHSLDFTYYGSREITLVKDGYKTHTVLQEVPSPWYQKPGIDFFSENLLPFKITNRHDFTYNLEKQELVPMDELNNRANALRSEAQVSQ